MTFAQNAVADNKNGAVVDAPSIVVQVGRAAAGLFGPGVPGMAVERRIAGIEVANLLIVVGGIHVAIGLGEPAGRVPDVP